MWSDLWSDLNAANPVRLLHVIYRPCTSYVLTYTHMAAGVLAVAAAAKLGAGFLASVSSPSIGFIFIVGRPRTYAISRCDFGSRVYLVRNGS